MKKIILVCILNITINIFSQQAQNLWHNIERKVRYTPDGEDFVITNGERRFNRAIYGTNTAFRIEAGDLPEFALYLPGMGGNLKFGLITKDKQKWLIDAENITARYRPGSMLYEIKDPLLGKGTIYISVLAIHTGEGMLVKIEFKEIEKNVSLIWVYGGANGKRFSRNGDIGADPESSFYLKPENCLNDSFEITENSFVLNFIDVRSKNRRSISGIFPSGSITYQADANKQGSPMELIASKGNEHIVLAGQINKLKNKPYYFSVFLPETIDKSLFSDMPLLIDQAETARVNITKRLEINTPDPYINTIGGALAIAGDAIWEEPSYLHGAVAWRSRIPGWRGAYVADPLGWHYRAKMHFREYAKSQYLEPESGPSIPDPEKNLARQEEKVGTALFTAGYISRNPGELSKPHHYDMNLVYIDALIRHFNWTGDTLFVKEMWPVIKRSLEWEKRCFDPDNDGLFNAYACIWASDALEYNGGGVMHSSSFNYLAFKFAANLAEIAGENPDIYLNESTKILNAINKDLWLPEKGWYAEYKDILGYKNTHPYSGLWSIYHALDSDVPDIFQAYQATRYIDNEIPHIPIIAEGLGNEKFYTLSTSNWLPYTWSVNNIALAELIHTSLAYWQANRPEEAFNLWKSSYIESMYLGASPGSFQQLSFYDAIRGELYRDFADPVGISARALVEGLFGINPDALNNTLEINPGFPLNWDHASISAPDISFSYKNEYSTDYYSITQKFEKPLNLKLKINAKTDQIEFIILNDEAVDFSENIETDQTIGHPKMIIELPALKQYELQIKWKGDEFDNFHDNLNIIKGQQFLVQANKAEMVDIYDPQDVLLNLELSKSLFNGNIKASKKAGTFFLKLKQGDFEWWQPVNITVKDKIEIIADKKQEKNQLSFKLKNNTDIKIKGALIINPDISQIIETIEINPNETKEFRINDLTGLIPGANTILIILDNNTIKKQDIVNWDIEADFDDRAEKVNFSEYFNDELNNIFKNEYLAPRSPYPTLQIPKQGVGDWCSYAVNPEINDSGLRSLAGAKNKIQTPQGIPFFTPGKEGVTNIVFTSLWENYPDEIEIPLSGFASHAYFLMAGTTNPMQSRIPNGFILIAYSDGSSDTLELANPENWWPIEQDYYLDGYAFSTNNPKPIRVNLKTGLITNEFNDYYIIKGFSNTGIEGGAATIIDMVLDSKKELKSLTLSARANDVVIGLMGITLIK